MRPSPLPIGAGRRRGTLARRRPLALLATALLACSSSKTSPRAEPPLVEVSNPAATGAQPFQVSSAQSAEASGETPRSWNGRAKSGAHHRLDCKLDGVRYGVSATATRQTGGWGVRVDVEAHSADGRTYTFKGMHEGLTFFGSIEWSKPGAAGGKGFGEGGTYSDKATAAPGKPARFGRDYPGSSKWDPIRPGEKLELTVITVVVPSGGSEAKVEFVVSLVVPTSDGAPAVRVERQPP